MNLVAEIVKALLVDGAVALFKFARRHPWLVAGVALFFIVLPFVWELYTITTTIFVAVLKIVDWVRGKDSDGKELPLPSKVARWVVVALIWLLVPFSSVLFSLLAASAALGRMRAQSLNASIATTTDK